MYWRIPGTWHANDLRKRISLIETASKDDGDAGTFIFNNGHFQYYVGKFKRSGFTDDIVFTDITLDDSMQENGRSQNYLSR